MSRFIQPARVPGSAGASPAVQSMMYTTGQTFKNGAVLILVAAGTVSEAAADPVAAIVGIALQGAGTSPGFEQANQSQVLQTTNIQQEVSVAVASSDTVFSGRAISAAGGDPTIPTQTLIGESRGLAKVGDFWVVDLDETVANSVKIVDIDVEQKIVFFKFLSTVLA